jgi:imidazoleglycerol-phosphate dehydratase
MERCSSIHRRTAETDIRVSLDLDGSGVYTVQTGIPFLDHMLSMVARHGFYDLEVHATGDLDVDYHHTVEDVGICLGQAFHQAMGSKQGMRRYASASVPLEETLAAAVIDFCDRPYLVYNVDMPPGRIGTFDVELVETFFLGFASHSGRLCISTCNMAVIDTISPKLSLRRLAEQRMRRPSWSHACPGCSPPRKPSDERTR